jgi:hypothetical protein
MTMTRRLSLALLGTGLIVVSLAFLGDKSVLYSVAIGYVTSALVMLASARAYANAVRSGVDAGAVTYDLDRDTIDKQEDPYDLYSEEAEQSAEDIKQAIADERARLKARRRSFGEMVRDSKPAFSLYRLGAYALVVVGFLYLHRHGWLALPYYLGSIALAPIVMVGVMMGKLGISDSGQ